MVTIDLVLLTCKSFINTYIDDMTVIENIINDNQINNQNDNQNDNQINNEINNKVNQINYLDDYKNKNNQNNKSNKSNKNEQSYEYKIIDNKIKKVTKDNTNDNIFDKQVDIEKIDKNMYILHVYAKLYNNLLNYKSIDSYLDQNTKLKELVNLFIEYIKKDEIYKNSKCLLHKQIVGYNLIEDKLESVLNKRYKKYDPRLNIMDWLHSNNTDISENDKLIIEAGIITRFYI